MVIKRKLFFFFSFFFQNNILIQTGYQQNKRCKQIWYVSIFDDHYSNVIDFQYRYAKEASSLDCTPD